MSTETTTFDILSEDVKVKVHEFNDNVCIDIRKYYIDTAYEVASDGKSIKESKNELLPTTKGISLSTDQWFLLIDNYEDINTAVKECLNENSTIDKEFLTVPLSEYIACKVHRYKKHTCIDIRKYYKKDSKILPGRGISLNPAQFDYLGKLFKGINALL